MPLNKNKFVIKRNDTLPALRTNIIDRGCLDGKKPFNLSGATGVTFSMIDRKCESYKISLQQAQISCVSGGTVQYNWQSGDTDESGNFLGEFEISFSDGKKMSVPQRGGILIEITNDISVG